MDQAKNLERFLIAQENAYADALREVRGGRKLTHWMWYIFPQLRGLGRSNLAWFFGIDNLEEAKAYLEHPVLGTRLREITQAALDQPECDALKLFGRPDDLKFRSCMTLFVCASDGDPLFINALNKFFDGKIDMKTVNMIENGDYS